MSYFLLCLYLFNSLSNSLLDPKQKMPGCSPSPMLFRLLGWCLLVSIHERGPCFTLIAASQMSCFRRPISSIWSSLWQYITKPKLSSLITEICFDLNKFVSHVENLSEKSYFSTWKSSKYFGLFKNLAHKILWGLQSCKLLCATDGKKTWVKNYDAPYSFP